MKLWLAVGVLGFLSACISPQEACIGQANSQYSALLSSISETQANITRGFAIHRQRVPYTYTGTCYSQYVGSYSCPQTGYRTQETPVAVNVSEERRKLQELQSLVSSYRAQSVSAVAQCRMQYPE
ncbi:MAG: hypothetical protein GQ535_14190 [Rhodobacteraceae bacterium]|nr:hypothetical protein [Paracoccaceae bacterium]